MSKAMSTYYAYICSIIVDIYTGLEYLEVELEVLLLWIIYVISVLFLLCFRTCLFINALWSPAGKGLASWLSFVMSNCEVPIGILGQVWCLIVSLPDLCPLSYFLDQ